MSNPHSADRSQFKDDLDALAQQAGTLKHDAAGFAHTAMDAAGSATAEMRDAAKDKLAEAKAKAAEAGTYVKNLVNDYPIASLAVALGVGLLAGVLLTRPRS